MVTRITPKQREIEQAFAVGIKPPKSWTAAQIRAKREAEEARIKRVCSDAIATSERYAKCYFWSRTGSASQRRSEEFSISEAFQWQGQSITVHQSLNISCRNFYFRSEVRRDGVRSNISYFKNILVQLR